MHARTCFPVDLISPRTVSKISIALEANVSEQFPLDSVSQCPRIMIRAVRTKTCRLANIDGKFGLRPGKEEYLVPTVLSGSNCNHSLPEIYVARSGRTIAGRHDLCRSSCLYRFTTAASDDLSLVRDGCGNFQASKRKVPKVGSEYRALGLEIGKMTISARNSLGTLQ